MIIVKPITQLKPLNLNFWNMKKQIGKLLLFLLANVLAFGLSAQKENYITNDTATTHGVRLIDGGTIENARYCKILRGKDTVRYTPYDLVEYGFKNGKVYVSKDISMKGEPRRVFLERIVDGPPTLYYYRYPGGSTFFLEKEDAPLNEIPFRNEQGIHFRKQLAGITSDCKNLQDAARVVAYKSYSMGTFFERYQDCELRPFPFNKIGLIAGVGASRLSTTEAQEDQLISLFDFKYDKSFVFGAFMNTPIAQSDFSTYAELMFFKTSYSYEGEDIVGGAIAVKYIEFNNTKTMFLLPLMARYTYPSNRIRPFVNAGLQASFVLQNTNSFIDRRGHDMQIYSIPVTIPGPGMGYVWGVGAEIKLDYRRNLFIEFRNGQLYNLSEMNNLREQTSGIYFGINY